MKMKMKKKKNVTKRPTYISKTAEKLAQDDRQNKLADVMRRVSAGDTSVVSEVYWLQMLKK